MKFILSLLLLFSLPARAETDDAQLLRIAVEVGYFDALKEATGIYDNSALINKANETGLSLALLKLKDKYREEWKNGGPVVTPPVVTPPVVVPPDQPTDKSFFSIHSMQGLLIAKQPAPGSYEYPKVFLLGFKNQYAPTGTSGCSIGYAEFRADCAFPAGGSLSLSDQYVGYKMDKMKFKIYIPAGTKTLMFTAYLPQYSKSAYSVRFGAAPAKTSITEAEYIHYQATEKIDTSFPRLMNGEELVVVHDGGGTVRFTAGQVPAIAKGGWLYFQQLQGTFPYDIQGGMDIDMAKYKEAYNSISWDSNGDPQ